MDCVKDIYVFSKIEELQVSMYSKLGKAWRHYLPIMAFG